MANRNALPIFSTSKVDLKQLRRNDGAGSPRTTTPEVSPRKTPNSARTPLTSRRAMEFKTPNSVALNTSTRQRWKSANTLSDTRAKSLDRTNGTPTAHTCSPSLSPKSVRTIHRSCSDLSFNDSIGLNSSIPHTPVSPRDETSNFVVGVRVRPFNARESSDKSLRNVICMKGNEVLVNCSSGTVHSFCYDHCFWSFAPDHPMFSSQLKVFSTMVQPMLDQLLQGYNACLLAYGQTGSGKSYSMMGIESGTGEEPSEGSGVIPRFCHALFHHLASGDTETRVEISYYEIYDEKIRDLLGGHGSATEVPNLKVRDHPKLGPHVVNLAIHGVKSFQDVQGWLTVGNSRRVTAATGVNEKSSRSHSIFTLLLTQMKDGITCRSKVNLVDLAGSERVAQTCAAGKQFKEGVSINKSLLSLGKVITFLAEKKKGRGAAPSYRESVLTWLLRESLGGNSRTAMLATISPNSTHMDETLATLRYACQARSIVNRVYRNEDANERVIRELRNEVAKLVAQLKDKKDVENIGNVDGGAEQAEIHELKEKLVEAENQLTQEQLPWKEKLKSAEVRKFEELQYLKRCGVTLQGQEDSTLCQQPCLVNLSADPVFSGTLLYRLPQGTAVVGTSSDCHIILQGPRIGPKHCEIESSDEGLWLIPIDDCETFKNGQKVTERTKLEESDRLVLSGIHFFRVQMPSQVPNNSTVDFEFAWKEVEAKLRGDLEAQRSAHAQQLDTVLTVLEAQADALEEERRVNRALGMERDVLRARVQVQDTPSKSAISPYRSTFLKDLDSILALRGRSNEKSIPMVRQLVRGINSLKSMMGEPQDLDSILSPSDRNNGQTPPKDGKKFNNSPNMLQLVREATALCSKMGLPLFFRQELVSGKYGLEHVVKMVDGQKKLSAILCREQFTTFLDAMRSVECPVDVLQMVEDVQWEEESQVEPPELPCDVQEANREEENLAVNMEGDSNAKRMLPEDEGNLSEIRHHLEEMKRHADRLQALRKNSPKLQLRFHRAIPHLVALYSALVSDLEEDNERTVRFDIPT